MKQTLLLDLTTDGIDSNPAPTSVPGSVVSECVCVCTLLSDTYINLFRQRQSNGSCVYFSGWHFVGFLLAR